MTEGSVAATYAPQALIEERSTTLGIRVKGSAANAREGMSVDLASSLSLNFEPRCRFASLSRTTNRFLWSTSATGMSLLMNFLEPGRVEMRVNLGGGNIRMS